MFYKGTERTMTETTWGVEGEMCQAAVRMTRVTQQLSATHTHTHTHLHSFTAGMEVLSGE